VNFADGFESTRVGWHEITAEGTGVHLDRSPVPGRSVSDELRHYPNDLLSSPLNIRSAKLAVEPGSGPRRRPARSACPSPDPSPDG
jgi:nickel/cobalt exporter